MFDANEDWAASSEVGGSPVLPSEHTLMSSVRTGLWGGE